VPLACGCLQNSRQDVRDLKQRAVAHFFGTALKFGKRRPFEQPRHVAGNFRDSWFKVPANDGGYLGGLGSMPSGHEIAVMAVATVFAERYPHPAWHRWLAYGLAAAVGVSRVTLQSHFTSDTFAGGVLGFAIARYVVLARQPAN